MLLLRIIIRPLFLTLTMIQLHTALFFFLLLPILASCDDEKVYIVYFGEHKGDKELQEIEDTHHSYLLSVKKSEEDAKSSLLYSYKYSINGFAAVLSPDEASKLSDCIQQGPGSFLGYQR
ncbi:unnamed protein product [Cuscuta epithymum]|uniref:Inhibitor I9 domain-containing protein n=1 Tax=Cuscuta epithymum TaxID=186058 RepID=A0AAV0DQJ2_9ASTE|nr:unnamed protein product [Cuscuta epithymum]